MEILFERDGIISKEYDGGFLEYKEDKDKMEKQGYSSLVLSTNNSRGNYVVNYKKATRKDKLAQEVKSSLHDIYDFSEYAQFCEERLEEIIDLIPQKALLWLKEEIDQVRVHMGIMPDEQ
jgi:hypothetical protein